MMNTSDSSAISVIWAFVGLITILPVLGIGPELAEAPHTGEVEAKQVIIPSVGSSPAVYSPIVALPF